MGGIALGLGAFGQAAGQYGQQVRSILESRRHDFANLMQQAASTEEDPDTRSAMLQHSIDASAGKPMGRVLQDFSGTLQKRVKDEQALHKGVQNIQSLSGQPPASPPPPLPGATPPGQVAGTGGNALPNVAQPATSPIAQPANGGQIQAPPPVGGISGAPNVEPVPDVTKEIPAPPDLPQPFAAPVAIPGATPPPISNTPVMSQPLGTGPSSPFSVPGLPIPETQEQIDAYFNSIPAWHTPHGQARLQGAYNQRLAHAEGLRNTLEAQQATLAYKQAGVQQMKQSGVWDTLPDIVKAQWQGEAYGLPAPPMSAGLMEPRLMSIGTLGNQAPPGTMEYGTNNPVKAGTRYRVMQVPMTGQSIWQPEADKTVITQTVGGPQVTNSITGSSIAPVEGAVSNSAIGYHMITLPDGRTAFVNEAGAAGNVPPVASGGINPSFVPSVSTSNQPGAPPITTTHTKGGLHTAPSTGAAPGGAIAPVVPPAINGGGIPPVGGAKPAGGASHGSEFNDPLAKANYENYMAGKGPAPTGRQLQGVQLYAQSHGLPMPDVLNGGGQKTISTLDPVLQQINDLLPRLNNIKGKSLIEDYQKYKNGFATPYDDIFTGVAFERLRSGSAALQGIGSRSFPVFNEGLKHTPTFDRLHGFNPDSVDLMIDKLSEARKIIQEERASAVADQKKSGVIPSLPVGASGAGGLTPPPTGSAVQSLIDKYK